MSDFEERPAGRVEVWQQAAGAWRWRFVEDGAGDGEPLELLSNTIEPSRDAAVSAAALAYPDVPVLVQQAPRGELVPRDRHRWIWRGATVGLAVALGAVALRHRRWWVALAAPLVARGVVARLRRSLP